MHNYIQASFQAIARPVWEFLDCLNCKNSSIMVLDWLIYLAGPSRHTISDFWRMAWQENVRCIVMATNVFEHARVSKKRFLHQVYNLLWGSNSLLRGLMALILTCVHVLGAVSLGTTDRPNGWRTTLLWPNTMGWWDITYGRIVRRADWNSHRLDPDRTIYVVKYKKRSIIWGRIIFRKMTKNKMEPLIPYRELFICILWSALAPL